MSRQHELVIKQGASQGQRLVGLAVSLHITAPQHHLHVACLAGLLLHGLQSCHPGTGRLGCSWPLHSCHPL